MSSKRKRNVAIVDPQVADDYSQEDSEQSESSEDDSDDSIEQMPDEKIMVDFELFNPDVETDSDGMKLLFDGFLGNTSFSARSLVAYITSRWWLGSSIKISGNTEDVFGIVSVINLHRQLADPDFEGVRQAIVEFLINQAPPSHRPTIQQLIDDTSKPLGLLINERFESIPPALVVVAQKNLFGEIALALEEEVEQEKPQPYEFQFENFIMISPAFSEGPKKKKARKNQPSKKQRIDDELLLSRSEEEVYEQFASLSFEVNSPRIHNRTLDGSFDLTKKIMVIPNKKIASILHTLECL